MAARAKNRKIPPEPLGQCDSNFIGMFQTVKFIQMMSLTFGLFTQVSGSGPLGPLVIWSSGYDWNSLKKCFNDCAISRDSDQPAYPELIIFG